MSYSTDRFAIAKDIKEWLSSSGTPPWGNIWWSDESSWKYSYLGDRDLLSYMNIYTEEIESFSKYYPDMDIFLQNIYWDGIFKSAKKIIEQVSKKISTDNNLIIIHASPLEMAVIGEFLKKHATANIAYNFNRIPAINSISKTLEAGLFLVSWEQIPWLYEKVEELRLELIEKVDTKIFSSSIFLFDENDIAPNWNISHIDPYIKSAIGYKENIVTYRVDEMPSSEFLLNRNIKDVYFFDTDSSNTINTYYQWILGDIFKYHRYIVDSILPDSIGYYEDYVVQKNHEYLIYKKEIFSKNEGVRKSYTGWWGMEKWKWKSKSSQTTGNSGSSPISLKEWLAYLGWLAIILPLFLLVEARWWASVFIKNAPSGWGQYSPTGSSGYKSSGSWGSSFSRSPSSSSSSSIKSFGGGGFSKWGG